MTLDQLEIGKSAIVKKVGGIEEIRLRFLDMGIIPHTKVTMMKAAPLGDPVEIRLRNYELTLRKQECADIEIEEIVE